MAREDVRLARMAIRKRWEPEPEQTHAVLARATEVALKDMAAPATVIAVAKLHLDAHRQVQADEHHDDRLEYHDRALSLRREVADVPLPITVNGSGNNICIFLPHNDRDEIDESLQGEMSPR